MYAWYELLYCFAQRHPYDPYGVTLRRTHPRWKMSTTTNSNTIIIGRQQYAHTRGKHISHIHKYWQSGPQHRKHDLSLSLRNRAFTHLSHDPNYRAFFTPPSQVESRFVWNRCQLFTTTAKMGYIYIYVGEHATAQRETTSVSRWHMLPAVVELYDSAARYNLTVTLLNLQTFEAQRSWPFSF